MEERIEHIVLRYGGRINLSHDESNPSEIAGWAEEQLITNYKLELPIDELGRMIESDRYGDIKRSDIIVLIDLITHCEDPEFSYEENLAFETKTTYTDSGVMIIVLSSNSKWAAEFRENPMPTTKVAHLGNNLILNY